MDAGAAAPQVYVVEGPAERGARWRLLLERHGCSVRVFAAPAVALEALARDPAPAVVVLDERADCLGELRSIKSARPDVEVVIATSPGSQDAALAALRAGAYPVLADPAEAEAAALIVCTAAGRRHLLLRARALVGELRASGPGITAVIAGPSPATARLRRLVTAAASNTAHVLLEAEPGVGAELVARAIHQAGPRREHPFVQVDLAAGAWAAPPAEGTIFLPRVEAAPPEAQRALLRFLDHEGARVIAGAHPKLETAVWDGRFSAELHARLKVLLIPVPPLRERRDDLPALTDHLLALVAARHGRAQPEVMPEVLEALASWPWPGNLPELEETLERAVIQAGDPPVVTLAGLPAPLTAAAQAHRSAGQGGYRAARLAALTAFDRAFVDGMLARTGGNISEAARLAGLDRANFKRIMRRVGPRRPP